MKWIKRLLLLASVVVTIAGTADRLTAQVPCQDCFIVQPGPGVIWECRNVPEGAPGYQNCYVGGSNCVMSGDCEPTFASTEEVEADGTAGYVTASANSVLRSRSVSPVFSRSMKDGLRLTRNCGGIVVERNYSAVLADKLRHTSKVLAL